MRPEERQSKSEKEKQEALRLQIDYHNTFTSGPGARVLKHMLLELDHFGPIDDEEQRIRSNYAKQLIMRICGRGAVNLPDVTIAGILSAATNETEGE
jgi:hypothetical protein